MPDQPNDKETLYDVLTAQAKQALEEQGFFAPLAMSVTRAGTFNITSGAAFESAEAGYTALIKILHDDARAGAIRTAGLCVQAHAVMPGHDEGTDIIAIFIEDAQHTSVQVWRPFTTTPTGIIYGEPVAVGAEPRIFT